MCKRRREDECRRRIRDEKRKQHNRNRRQFGDGARNAPAERGIQAPQGLELITLKILTISTEHKYIKNSLRFKLFFTLICSIRVLA